MKTVNFARVAAGALILLVLTVGCGRTVSRPHVHGMVTYRGQPVGNQTLTLVSEGPPDERFTHRIIVKADGTFSGEAPVPGNYKVVIEQSMAAMEGRAPAATTTIPEKYRTADATDLTWTIEPGDNERDFELTD